MDNIASIASLCVNKKIGSRSCVYIVVFRPRIPVFLSIENHKRKRISIQLIRIYSFKWPMPHLHKIALVLRETR